LLAPAIALCQESRTVLGPSNIDLYEGAQLLKEGEAEEGLRRTLRGLDYAETPREKVSGMSNACAGYLMLDKPEEAIPWCDQALEIQERYWRALTNRAMANLKLGRFEECDADISRAEEIAPGSQTVKRVRALLLDITDPVSPHIVIDDRRQPAADE
jgi:tetratricopeptide (TPR) repeat protein